MLLDQIIPELEVQPDELPIPPEPTTEEQRQALMAEVMGMLSAGKREELERAVAEERALNASTPEALRQQPSPLDQEDKEISEVMWRDFKKFMQNLAVSRGHYFGYPVPDDECPLVTAPNFPLNFNGLLLNDKEEDETEYVDDALGLLGVKYHKTIETMDNTYSVVRKPNGHVKMFRFPKVNYMERLNMQLYTLGASRCWDWDAELRAMDKLSGMVTEHAMKYYLLTGSMLESSPRSNIMYFLRRCRPTIALSSWNGRTRPLTSLCIHPVGYYQGSFAGAMVPTDDIIAHLLLIRGDEHTLWKKSNHHPIDSTLSGV